MITAKGAQQLSCEVAEEGIKDQLSEISKLIAEACKSGQRSLRIEDADKKSFPTAEGQLDAVFVLETKYGYKAFYSDGKLSIYWY